MYILAVGLNHKTAPIGVREKLAFDRDAAAKAVTELKRKYPVFEFVLLSTCNRVELYAAVSKDSEVRPTEIAASLVEIGGAKFESLRKHLYVMRDQHAVRHLLTVTASLDSMVIGENQISSQVKESYAIACETKSSGKVLNHLFHSAFATSKSVFTQTSIANRRVSVAGVAVELAKQLFDEIKKASVTVVGAGEMGELLVEHFQHVGCEDITVVNRTQSRSCSLAERRGVGSAEWEKLEDEVAGANVVVAAAANDGYIFDKKQFSRIMSKRDGRTLLVIDITVPRSFDPAINEIENVYLYCIDDLSQVVESNIKLREGDLEKAVEIICHGVAEYMNWFTTRDVGPLIGQMKEAFEQISKAEMEKFFAGQREQAHCKEMMDATMNRVVNKLLHCVIQNIDYVANQHSPDEAARLAEVILSHASDMIEEEKG